MTLILVHPEPARNLQKARNRDEGKFKCSQVMTIVSSECGGWIMDIL